MFPHPLKCSVIFQCVIEWSVTFLKCPDVRMVRLWFWKTLGNVSPYMSAVGHFSIVSSLCEREHTTVWPLWHAPLKLCSLLVCRKEECALRAPLVACSAHRQPSIKKTKCCDVYECACSCQNSTRSCPAGFSTSTSTNDCGCTQTSCLPDLVSLCLDVTFSAYLFHSCLNCPVLSLCVPPGVCGRWRDSPSGEWMGGEMWEVPLYPAAGQRNISARCSVYPTCLRSDMPLGETHTHTTNKVKIGLFFCLFSYIYYTFKGSTYSSSEGQCCGKCKPTSCVESEGVMRGDTLIGGKLRHVCV